MTTSLGTVDVQETRNVEVTPNTQNDGPKILDAAKEAASGLGWLVTGAKKIVSGVMVVPSWLIYQGAKLTGNYDVALEWADAAWVGSPQNKKSLIFADFAQKNKNRMTKEQLTNVEHYINEASLADLLYGGNYDPAEIMKFIQDKGIVPNLSSSANYSAPAVQYVASDDVTDIQTAYNTTNANLQVGNTLTYFYPNDPQGVVDIVRGMESNVLNSQMTYTQLRNSVRDAESAIHHTPPPTDTTKKNLSTYVELANSVIGG